MKYADDVLDAARQLRLYKFRTITKHGGSRNPLSLWLAPIRYIGRKLNVDSIVLYTPSKRGKDEIKKVVFRSQRRLWRTLKQEQEFNDRLTALIPLHAPKTVRQKSSLPLAFLGFFKKGGFVEDEIAALEQVCDFFSDMFTKTCVGAVKQMP